MRVASSDHSRGSGASTRAPSIRPDGSAGLYNGDMRTLDVAGAQVEATEVVSVGLERMATDPLQFARRDWEYFSFILRRVVWR